MKLTFSYNMKVFVADLPPSMTLADMAAYIEAETNLPSTHQTLIHKYIQLSPSNTTTLEESNIKEGDIIIISAFDPVEDNLQRAYNENPEFFADVTMLYIKVSINGYDVPAFIDTGAQRTLMTPELCEKCDLNHLVDLRFKAQAKGVGEKESSGRIHSVPMLIGGEVCNTSLTILDIADVGLLIGLDWMKSFKVKIDLNNNGIFIGDTFVEFLSEWEVKRMQSEYGIKVDQSSEKKMHPLSNLPNPLVPNSLHNHQPSSNVLTSEQKQKINNLVDLGFDETAASQALEACGWNVDMAAGMLF